MRQTALHATAFTVHSERMELLRNTVVSGNATLMGQITASRQLASRDTPHQMPIDDTGRTVARSRRGRAYKYRLPLPGWFAKCVWELFVHEANQGWTVQLYPINLRPEHTYAFDFVRRGDVKAVRELMRLGHLSMNDQANCEYYQLSLLNVSLLPRRSRVSSKLTTRRWPHRVAALNFAGFCFRQPHCFTKIRPCAQRCGPL
jgi:hypothetical protein